MAKLLTSSEEHAILAHSSNELTNDALQKKKEKGRETWDIF
jgi:hypothetical protein